MGTRSSSPRRNWEAEAGQPNKRDVYWGQEFIGVWELVSMKMKTESGKVIYAFGKHPKGILIYTRTMMSVHIHKDDRIPFESGDLQHGTPEEIQSAFQSWISYYADYSVDKDSSRVVHHIHGSAFPNWTGQDHIRMVQLEQDVLQLRTPALKIGGRKTYSVLKWRRRLGEL